MRTRIAIGAIASFIGFAVAITIADSQHRAAMAGLESDLSICTTANKIMEGKLTND
jgi:hypothetical protein